MRERMRDRLERMARRVSYLSPSGKARLGPKWLVLAINNRCNLHCKMCDVGTGESETIFFKNLIGDGTGNMSLRLFDRILDDAAAFPARPGVSFAYTEPGIHPEALELVARAKSRGLFASLITNGSTLPKLAAGFVELGLDQLFVSIDGPREIHDAIRGSDKSYERIVEGLEEVAAAKARSRSKRARPTVNVSFVFTEESYLSLVRLLQDLAPLRPDRVFATLLNFIHPSAAAVHNARFGSLFPATVTNLRGLDLAAFDPERMAQEIRRARECAAELGIGLSVLPDLSTAEELARYFRDPFDPVAGDMCRDPWTSVLIQTNGDVIPAHGRCFNTVMGNLESSSLAEIWSGSRMQELRRSLKKEGGSFEVCKRCCGVFGGRAVTADRGAFAMQRFLDPHPPTDSARAARLRVI